MAFFLHSLRNIFARFIILLYTNVSELKRRVKFPLHNTIAVYYTFIYVKQKHTYMEVDLVYRFTYLAL